MPDASYRPGGRGRAGRCGGIVDGMQIPTVLDLALAALAGLCAFVTTEAAR
nr:hypothetical protein [Streptomyces sp. ST1020]